MQTWRIDYDYLKTRGMDLKKGRNFSKDFGTDSTAVIINETTAALLGYENPIGKKIHSLANAPQVGAIPYTIIGVVKNFNYESLKQNIAALCFLLGKAIGQHHLK